MGVTAEYLAISKIYSYKNGYAASQLGGYGAMQLHGHGATGLCVYVVTQLTQTLTLIPTLTLTPTITQTPGVCGYMAM